MKALEMIGEINEAELMEISEGNEMVAGASSWICASAMVAIYVLQDSANSCPTSACTSRC
jgi:hypothetical protein